MSRVLRLGFVAGVGLSGWFGGAVYEQRRQEHREPREHRELGRIPGLPLGPKVLRRGHGSDL